jgi:hypothetical protein
LKKNAKGLTHNLNRLAELAELAPELTLDQIDLFAELTAFHIEARYGDYRESHSEIVDAQKAKEVFELTALPPRETPRHRVGSQRKERLLLGSTNLEPGSGWPRVDGHMDRFHSQNRCEAGLRFGGDLLSCFHSLKKM